MLRFDKIQFLQNSIFMNIGLKQIFITSFNYQTIQKINNKKSKSKPKESKRQTSEIRVPRTKKALEKSLASHFRNQTHNSYLFAE